MRKKLGAYARYAATSTPLYGVVDPIVLFVAKNLRRLRTIAVELKAQGVRARVIFSLVSVMDQSNVLNAAYALPSDILDAPTVADMRVLFSRTLLP